MTPERLWSRPLAPLTAALAAGIASPGLGLALTPLWTAWAVGALLLTVAVLLWRGYAITWPGCLLFLFLGLGLCLAALQPKLPQHHVVFLPRDKPVSIIGIVPDRPLPGATGHRMELAALSWSAGGPWQPATGRVLLYGLKTDAGLLPGDQVAVRLTLRSVGELKNPDSFHRKVALARRQIYVTGNLWQHIPPVKISGAEALAEPLSRRQQVREHCRAVLEKQPQPARSIFLAILLGDQSEISPGTRQALQRTGTSHLVAISGLHLGLIAFSGFCLVFWLFRRSAWLLLRLNALKWSVVLSIVPVGAYVWLAEGSPATQRAAVMILAYLLLVLLDRHRDLYSVLVLAAFIILVASPLQLYALSFQLSFLSVWGIAYISPVVQRPWRQRLEDREELPFWLRKVVLGVMRACSATLAATLATLPVIVADFHQIPTYGIVINILTIPLLGGIVLPLALLGLLLSGLSLTLAAGVLELSRLVLEAAFFLIHQASLLPGVVWRLPALTVWQTVGYVTLLVSLFGSWPRRWRWTGVSLGVLVLAGSLVWSGLGLFSKPRLEITALDTNEEMALVANFPGNVPMVVSAGGPWFREKTKGANRALLSLLHRQRWRRLDIMTALTVTGDNAATLLAVAREFEVKEFWYGGDRPYLADFWELRNLLGDSGREVLNLSLASLRREIGGVRVSARQLRDSLGGRTGGPVLLRLDYQGNRLLIIPPGKKAWREKCLAAGLEPHEVVIIPATALMEDSGKAWLSQTRPQALVVTGSIPPDLPDKFKQDAEIKWYFTNQGAVTLIIDQRGWRVRQWRP